MDGKHPSELMRPVTEALLQKLFLLMRVQLNNDNKTDGLTRAVGCVPFVTAVWAVKDAIALQRDIDTLPIGTQILTLLARADRCKRKGTLATRKAG